MTPVLGQRQPDGQYITVDIVEKVGNMSYDLLTSAILANFLYALMNDASFYKLCKGISLPSCTEAGLREQQNNTECRLVFQTVGLHRRLE